MIINKESFFTIVIEFFRHLFGIFYTVIFLVAFLKLSYGVAFLISLVIFILSVAYSILSWNKKLFYIEEDIFYYKKGIFFKKEVKIPLKNIVAVDIKQSFVQGIFGLQTLVVDRGLSDDIEDISLVLDKRNSIYFRDLLLSSDNENEVSDESQLENSIPVQKNSKISGDGELIYKINNKDLLIYCFTKRSLMLFITGVFFISSLVFEFNLNLDSIFNYLLSPNRLVFALVGTLILFKLIATVINLNKFYNFRIKKLNNILDLSHGFFNKKVSSLNLDNICAIKIEQSFLQKRFKKVSISVNTAGYGDSPDEESIVFPCIDEVHVDEVIKGLFSNFEFRGEVHRINPLYKLKYKNASIGYNEELIYISGNIFRKSISIISLGEVDEIKSVQSFIGKRRGAFKLKLRYKSMKFGDLSSVPGLDLYHFEDIKKLLLEKN